MSELVVGSLKGLSANSFVIDVASGSSLDLSAGAVLPSGSVIQVKSVALTGTFTASLGSGAASDITGLSITHEVASSGNKVLLMCDVGLASNSDTNRGVGIFFAEGATALNIGDAASNRSRVGSGRGASGQVGDQSSGSSYAISFLHTPTSGSKTYVVRVSNLDDSSSSVFINRTAGDGDNVLGPRASTTFTLMEIAG